MRTVACSSPFIPPEWIVAHGFQPAWAPLGRATEHASAGVNRGLCAYAESLLDAATADGAMSALVMATTCDQVRHVAALAEARGRLPLFLLNAPATWENPAARQYYREELQRLGRFLVELGGQPPSQDALASVMFRYDRAREAIRLGASRWPARRLAEAILEYRNGMPAASIVADSAPGRGVPLALVGGPLMPQDFAIFELVERSGGRIVLDASETGERTLPPALRSEAVSDRPLETLADAYFLGIPDVFRRPNDCLYKWLGQQMALRKVEGIVLRRYVWCDLWHAELRRLAQWSRVPLLEIDVADDEDSFPGRTLERLEAFLDTLRQADVSANMECPSYLSGTHP
jgi:benzoyl-CoA reductase/2-hydroxyglutaryl-CoA dehydratase subunit BcrC/BadD/HgdB